MENINNSSIRIRFTSNSNDKSKSCRNLKRKTKKTRGRERRSTSKRVTTMKISIWRSSLHKMLTGKNGLKLILTKKTITNIDHISKITNLSSTINSTKIATKRFCKNFK